MKTCKIEIWKEISLVTICALLFQVNPYEAKQIQLSSNDLVIATAYEGSIVGQVTPEAGIFFGIPFSQPPTGEFRWRRPRDPLKYESRYWNATYKRPGCQQVCEEPAPEYSCPAEISEDCLYLNVWVPKRLLMQVKADNILDIDHYAIRDDYRPGGESRPLAVMVWYHGGNFKDGSGSSILYDGRFMANQGDVIVVTTNYRLAHLGFLVQGENGSEEAKGNFGFWDQVKTLEWVNRNIRNFGGDPNKVTIFGQSAGSESIGVHLTSNVSKDLFHKSIMQSNPLGLPFRNLRDAKVFGDRFAESVGCKRNDMFCLRSKSVQELEKAYNKSLDDITNPALISTLFQPWSPVIDGDIVPDQPVKLFLMGQAQNKPLLLGSTVDEGVLFIDGAFSHPVGKLVYDLLLAIIFKQDYLTVVERYPGECKGNLFKCDYRDMASEMATEYIFLCPQRKSVNSLKNNDIWWYIFNQTWSFYEVWGQPACYHHVCHGSDLGYIFNVESLTKFNFTENERGLAKRMITYWTNFAKYGDPNGAQTMSKVKNTQWPSFNQTHQQGMYQALQLTANKDFVMQQPYKEACDFWDKLNRYADHVSMYHHRRKRQHEK